MLHAEYETSDTDSDPEIVALQAQLQRRVRHVGNHVIARGPHDVKNPLTRTTVKIDPNKTR